MSMLKQLWVVLNLGNIGRLWPLGQLDEPSASRPSDTGFRSFCFSWSIIAPMASRNLQTRFESNLTGLQPGGDVTWVARCCFGRTKIIVSCKRIRNCRVFDFSFNLLQWFSTATFSMIWSNFLGTDVQWSRCQQVLSAVLSHLEDAQRQQVAEKLRSMPHAEALISALNDYSDRTETDAQQLKNQFVKRMCRSSLWILIEKMSSKRCAQKRSPSLAVVCKCSRLGQSYWRSDWKPGMVWWCMGQEPSTEVETLPHSVCWRKLVLLLVSLLQANCIKAVRMVCNGINHDNPTLLSSHITSSLDFDHICSTIKLFAVQFHWI